MTCFECGDVALHEHHVVPRSRGGTKTVPLCEACHGLAHHCNGNMSTKALTKEALERRRERLGWGGGSVPWGYQRTKSGHIVLCEAEQATTARAEEMRKSGMSFRAITKALDREGHVCRSGKPLTGTAVVRLLKHATNGTEFGLFGPMTTGAKP
jgi:hypothetical protein